MSYNIEKNREPLGEDDFSRGKDFNRFLKDHKPGSPGSYLRMGGMIAIGTAVLAITLLLTLEDQEKKEQSLLPGHNYSFVEPPLEGVTISSSESEVQTEQGDTLFHPGGSVIYIPPGAFLDKDGNPVKGKVRLKYREFHTPADFFLSGIPMTYDSAGETHHFESAGMIELLAFQGNDPVFANPRSPVRIELASSNPGNHFNLYYLDPVTGNWDYIRKDTSGTPDSGMKELDSLLDHHAPEQVETMLEDELKKEEKQLGKLEKQKPQFPGKADKTKYHFNIDVDSARFPELSKFKNVTFEVSDRTKSFKPEKASKTWRSVKIDRTKEEGYYMITFSDWKESYSIIAIPVLEGEEYEKAKKDFDEKFATFKDEWNTKLNCINRKRDQLKKLNSLYKSQADTDNRDQNALLLYNSEKVNTVNTIYRVFYAEKFGIWNCDCPKMLPKGADVVAVFCDSTGKPLKHETVYLVEKVKNQMYTYYPSALSHFRYNPVRQNVVWLVTNDNKLAVISPDQFKKVKPAKDTCVYRMKIIDAKIASEEDARKYLKIN